jgi:DNA repair protein RecN (Recombination protein N)
MAIKRIAMLLELKIRNFVIIENSTISFKNGFNVLSGETGSGKSVLLKGLSVLMGANTSNDLVGPWGTDAHVEGFFDISERIDIKKRLQELGIQCDDETIIVRRVIGKKNRVFINGSLVTLTELKNLVTPILEIAGPFSAPLMEMTGQHDTKQLLSTGYHRFLLDLYAGLAPQLEVYKQKYAEREALIQEIDDIQKKSKENIHQLDFLKYQLQEIQNFELDIEKDSKLQERIFQVKNKQKFLDFLASADNLLNQSEPSVLGGLHKIVKMAEPFEDNYESIRTAVDNLKTALTLVEDSSFELANLASEDSEIEESLEDLTDRFTRLRGLQKKYGEDLNTLAEAEESLRKEIEMLDNADSVLEAKELLLEDLEAELMGLASKMHDLRKESSETIVQKVNAQLEDLNMKGVKFFIGLERMNELNKYGNSKIEFLVQSHKDSEKRALAKTASGGELSRILLSIKTVLGENEWPRTYLFDEVDTGVSGPTAQLVGKKLKELSLDQQVLCVTHLPQVAAEADHHFVIEKLPQGDQFKMSVRELDKKQRVNEIARLISGETISESSREHARKLLGM